ncbi:hypothetical protein AWC38_SpisGene14915 [Stylophora pistillata]|uniref:Reverse transcriptase domain-containing protein n=1 Tax=Stylophora pistillata TaxID=50429 RepID=A0A2B4RV11_STYPI|nr:hypothetical protein AWC38_SpisGene14915 [Stylophora pistillata]
MRFNQFLGNLTLDFSPLDPPSSGMVYDVPPEFLIDERTAYHALRRVQANKSPGPDLSPNRVWSEFAFELSSVVCDIYNSSIIQRFIPSQLKQSIVCPVPKCSPPEVVEEDLRPIALTSQLAKIFEGFTYSSLLSQVQDHLDDKQSAVARKYTTHALVYFMHVSFESLDREGMYARILFTDFSKGFDVVDHRALLHELEVLGVHEAIVRWVGAFLVGRLQRVRINGQLSSTISPRGGIPQVHRYLDAGVD